MHRVNRLPQNQGYQILTPIDGTAGNKTTITAKFEDVTIGIDNTVATGSAFYRYKFNGKELQDELGLELYDFHARNYMPDIGRFFNPDPLSEQYAYQSHYNFSENRVIDGRELEGLEWKSIKNEDTGITNSNDIDLEQSLTKSILSNGNRKGGKFHLFQMRGKISKKYYLSGV